MRVAAWIRWVFGANGAQLLVGWWILGAFSEFMKNPWIVASLALVVGAVGGYLSGGGRDGGDEVRGEEDAGEYAGWGEEGGGGEAQALLGYHGGLAAEQIAC